LLAQTILTPINGRVSDITGRKPMLYASIIVLMIFSALCGAAKNITWYGFPFLHLQGVQVDRSLIVGSLLRGSSQVWAAEVSAVCRKYP